MDQAIMQGRRRGGLVWGGMAVATEKRENSRKKEEGLGAAHRFYT